MPVGLVVSQVAAGRSLDDVAREHGITAEDVRAALEYAARRASETPDAVRDASPSTVHDAANNLSPEAVEEARKLGLDITKMSPLGRDLLEIRARGIAAGDTPLLTWEELDAEIADRRGGEAGGSIRA